MFKDSPEGETHHMEDGHDHPPKKLVIASRAKGKKLKVGVYNMQAESEKCNQLIHATGDVRCDNEKASCVLHSKVESEKWEEEFDEKFNDLLSLGEVQTGISERDNFKDFICQYFIPKVPSDYPMGVSQWKEHGKKYGYWEFFERKDFISKDRVREMVEGKIEHYRKTTEKGEVNYIAQLQDLLKLIQEE